MKRNPASNETTIIKSLNDIYQGLLLNHLISPTTNQNFWCFSREKNSSLANFSISQHKQLKNEVDTLYRNLDL